MRKIPITLMLAAMGCASNSDTGGSGGGPGAGGSNSGSSSGGSSNGGSAGASSSGGAGGNTTTGSGGAGGSMPAACTGCTASQGCLRVDVTRAADDTRQPWKVWPTEVDGVGMLIVAATPMGGAAVRKTLDGADMKPASASFAVDVGCVPVGSLTVNVFLDDNGNASSGESSSSDYRDSCGSPRSQSVAISAGQTAQLGFPLANSCD